MQGFIDGVSITPARFIKKVTKVMSGDSVQDLEVLEFNPDYDEWDTRKKIVMSWIC